MTVLAIGVGFPSCVLSLDAVQYPYLYGRRGWSRGVCSLHPPQVEAIIMAKFDSRWPIGMRFAVVDE